MIGRRVLKGQTDKLYFCTSLAPPNVIPSGSLALLLSPSTTGCSDDLGVIVQAYRVRRSTSRYGLSHRDQSRRDVWMGVITPHFRDRCITPSWMTALGHFLSTPFSLASTRASCVINLLKKTQRYTAEGSDRLKP